MIQAPELPPVHMRRDAFDPTPELREIRETVGARTTKNAFGMDVFLVTRHEDIKAVLSDHERFSNSRPPGFVVPGAPDISEEELASARAGNLLSLDPPEHQRVRRMLTAEFTIRRMKQLQEAGPHGDADRVPGAAAPLSGAGSGQGVRRRVVPVVPLHLRSESTGGSVVMVP